MGADQRGSSERISRRDLLKRGSGAAAGLMLPWHCQATREGEAPAEPRSVIVLRMDGGPSQFDTWAPSPDGPFRSRSTSAAGVRYCERMPRLADWAHRFAVIADVATPEINHKRARYLMRVGEPAPPTVVPETPPPSCPPVWGSADPRYGPSAFGRQCQAAFRQVRNGAKYAEAILTGWDTHTDNAPRVARLLADMDPAMAALMADLEATGLLRTTLVVWMGEFGRTHAINRAAGRDHDPNRSCIVLAGAGVRGGSVLCGKLTPIADVFATMVALGRAFGPRPMRFALQGSPISEVMISPADAHWCRLTAKEGERHGLV